MTLTPEIEAKIVALYLCGATYVDCKKQVGVSEPTVAAVLKRNGIQPRPRGRRPRRKRVGE